MGSHGQTAVGDADSRRGEVRRDADVGAALEDAAVRGDPRGGLQTESEEPNEIAESLSVNETVPWPYQRLVALVRFGEPVAWETQRGEIQYDWPILAARQITSPVISGQSDLFRIRRDLVQRRHRDG